MCPVNTRAEAHPSQAEGHWVDLSPDGRRTAQAMLEARRGWKHPFPSSALGSDTCSPRENSSLQFFLSRMNQEAGRSQAPSSPLQHFCSTSPACHLSMGLEPSLSQAPAAVVVVAAALRMMLPSIDVFNTYRSRSCSGAQCKPMHRVSCTCWCWWAAPEPVQI